MTARKNTPLKIALNIGTLVMAAAIVFLVWRGDLLTAILLTLCLMLVELAAIRRAIEGKT